MQISPMASFHFKMVFDGKLSQYEYVVGVQILQYKVIISLHHVVIKLAAYYIIIPLLNGFKNFQKQDDT